MVKIQPKTLFVGKKLIYLPSCHSTNDIAAEIIQKEGKFHGTVIVSDFQSAGKGQRGNMWESAAQENLLMSLVLDTAFLPLDFQFFLSMVSALAIQSTASGFGIKNSKIKWPNDIFIGKKKIGGILIESAVSHNSFSSSIVGIGINVFQKQFSSIQASSILQEYPKIKITRDILLEKLCENFEAHFTDLQNNKFEKIKKEYVECLLGYNEEIKFRDKTGVFFGRITDVKTNGLLEVSTIDTKKYYDIKEIEHLFHD